VRITEHQLRRIIREALSGPLEHDREESFTPEQRKIARMFTRWDRDQITQALELNRTLGILPEPTKFSFMQAEWNEMTDEERRELEGIPIDKYPHDNPIRPNVLLDIAFATSEDADLWMDLWLKEGVGTRQVGGRSNNYIQRRGPKSFWIWAR
jgi:hypothetical protein